VADTADPLAGSYAIESLTLELETRATELIDRIDSMGGALQAIESGWIQSQIAESAYRAQRDLEEDRSVIVGVNRFVEEESRSVPLLELDEKIERDQIDRTAAFRAARESDPARSADARAALQTLAEAAAGDRNLLLPIVEAVRASCTIGESVRTLRETFGEHKEHGF
jgi:methylmalonyl-CoA mutase, N-terminal domain